jgi:peptide/nickel transport system substrate-binding protein
VLSRLQTTVPDYREGLVSDERPISLNPLVGASDPSVHDVGALLYRSLLRLDGRAAPVADLAVGYTISADGLVYHLPLQVAQRWSDGRPLTAADVIATIDWVQSPGFGDAATASAWRDVHARIDGDGVSFDLAGPRASFLAQLAQLPILPIASLNHAALLALPKTAAVPMATSGAFEVAGATAGTVLLLPNPHAAAAPHLRQMAIVLFGTFADAAAAFSAGNVDGVLATDPLQRAELTAAGGISHSITTFRFVDLLFNERNPVTADLTVRQAVATTLDRGKLIAGPLRGMAVPQVGAIPAGVAWAAPRLPQPVPNPAAAASALDTAGWVQGADGVRVRASTRLQLHLVVADIIPLPDVAAGVASQLARVGISVQVTSMPIALLRQLLVGGSGYDLAIADWDSGPDPDVSSFWRSTAVPPAGLNVSGGPANPFLDESLDRLTTTTDPAMRAAAAATVSSQLADDLPAVFLETPDVALVVRPGLTVMTPPVGSSASRFADISSWRRG